VLGASTGILFVFNKMLAELGQVAGWNAGLAFLGLAAVVIAIPAAANANLPAAGTQAISLRAKARPAAPPPAPPQFVFADPLPGREVDSPFGLRELPWERHGRLHEGVDIAAPAGSPVHATLPGVVARIGVSPSYGRFVEVVHSDGLSSFYAHLKKAARYMKPGRIVEPDEVLGFVGSSGHSTGPHLHFEIRKDGAPLNPESFMDHQFATASDLPFEQAAEIGKTVRIAQVSSIPAAFRGRMRAMR
jgi:murein DD-endopeptidase MepM/ murein hydrolase activator NlpD